jgi:uncharacterized protein YrrD
MNVKQLIGMKIFAIDEGKNLGVVDRLLFSPEEKRVSSFLIAPEGGLLDEPEPHRLLKVSDLTAVGEDAITVESDSVLSTTVDGELPPGTVAFDEVEKERVLTEGGNEIGELVSIEFSEDGFALEHLEVSRGFLGGHTLIPLSQVVSIGEDVIVVMDAALDEIEEPEDDDGKRGLL